MDKRTIKAAVAVLGALVGASMLDCKSASALSNGWIQSSPSGYSTCFDSAINDSGTRAGNCIVSNHEIGFVQLGNAPAPTQLAALPSTANGVPCGITALSNASAGNEIIMGWCNDANAVSQGVFWKSSTPTTAPTLLRPLSLLGLDPDVQTQAAAVNSSGVMVGVSISSSGTKTPVTWSSTGAATQLAAPLGSVNTNCVPIDISDASTPEIVANCQDAATGGGNKIVYWQGAGATYKVLGLPPGATSCTFITVNANGQGLGQCDYPGDVTHAVAYSSARGLGYSVLTNINLNNTSKTYAVDMNDNGTVACNYFNTNGSKQPCLWDPSDGNFNANTIALPTSNGGIAVAIGNNGKVVGNYDVSGSGYWLPFSTPPYNRTSVSGGSPSGSYSGQQTSVSKMTRGGAFEAATFVEVGSWVAIDVVKSVP
jgi:hypothetical protein